MNCETTNVSKKQISELFRVHINTVDNWCKAGLPYRKEAREYRFDLADVIAWHHNFISNIAGDIPSLVEAKRRREHYQAELKRLQLETAEGDLVRTDLLMTAWLPIITTMRSKLLALPSRLTPLLFGCQTKGEIHASLKKYIYEALEELGDEQSYRKTIKGKKKGKK